MQIIDHLIAISITLILASFSLEFRLIKNEYSRSFAKS